jgi:multidrug efflux pump subunit AcrA (membrane-fusion protein)
MKEHIKSLPHHPKRVIIICVILALIIGFWSYIKINQKPEPFTIPVTTDDGTDGTIANQNLTLAFLAGGRIASVSVKAGDMVKKGQILATLNAGSAVGALTEAKADYANAEANYEKVINGATGTAIDVAKAAVNTAQINLDEVTKQQNVLVVSAYANLLNSSLITESDMQTSLTPPLITGVYTENAEGVITLTVNQGGQNGYFSISGLVSGNGIVSGTTPEPISNTGLYIEFPTDSTSTLYTGTNWNINIPNEKAPDYLTNYDAYQTALQNQSQTVKSAQAVLDQANASLSDLAAAARPEDVAVAQAQVDNALGAVQIAQAAYDNTIIIAPEDGTITAISIAPGQIAMPNVPAIQFISVDKTN